MRAVERRYKYLARRCETRRALRKSVINITENLFLLRRKIRLARWRQRVRGRAGREDGGGDIRRDAAIADDSERVPDSHIVPPENRTRHTRTFDCGA